jgi:hypothetical protein
MTPVLTRPRPQAAPARLGREIALLAAGGLVALAVILGMSAAVEGPAYVDRVTVHNPTPYALEIQVADDGRDAWLDLGPVSSGERHTFSTVVDHGDRWVVRISSAGIDGGQFELGRAGLERRGWVVTIPDDVSARLAANGAKPPATPSP